MKRASFEIVAYTAVDQRLPASFDGCRIVYLSDLHNNTFGEENALLTDAVNELHPDYIFLGGDMLVGREDMTYEANHIYPLLKGLTKTAHVYYSIGNHEERLRMGFLSAYKKAAMEIGVTFLDNESIVLKQDFDTIEVFGLSLSMEYYKRFWNRKPLLEADLCQIHPYSGTYMILLAHNPVYFKTYAAYGANLVLSGHHHGGLIIVPGFGGIISPEFMILPYYDYGQFYQEQSQMILSRGAGAHTLPIRIHNVPEIMVITLKKACTKTKQ